MCGLFMAISPKLRYTVTGTLESAADTMQTHSPFSYVGLGVVAILLMMFMVYRGAQPQ